jgi:hypothetical protein
VAEYHSCLRVACLVPDYPAQAHKDDLLFRVGKVWVVRGEGGRTARNRAGYQRRPGTRLQRNAMLCDATRPDGCWGWWAEQADCGLDTIAGTAGRWRPKLPMHACGMWHARRGTRGKDPNQPNCCQPAPEGVENGKTVTNLGVVGKGPAPSLPSVFQSNVRKTLRSCSDGAWRACHTGRDMPSWLVKTKPEMG